jgi:hypothetical protein
VHRQLLKIPFNPQAMYMSLKPNGALYIAKPLKESHGLLLIDDGGA